MDTAYAMGGLGGQGAGGSTSGLGNLGIVFPILIIAIFYFLIIRPQQSKAKQQRTFLANLKKGDTIVTSGGLYGKITGITDEAVTIEIAEKVRVKVSKSAVAGYAKGEQA
ncbi:MAG TPA: preprotein translocase subunit YajC [Syntrophorhabdales bacterium]|nr:preprotein translocase subunit YajC [Syntrophorhabdales bacterium]